MQYILTQEEYDDANNRMKEEKRKLVKIINDLCQQVADHKPVSYWRTDTDRIPMPWQCIKSVKNEWYCDDCPVRNVCMETEKHFSK